MHRNALLETCSITDEAVGPFYEFTFERDLGDDLAPRRVTAVDGKPRSLDVPPGSAYRLTAAQRAAVQAMATEALAMRDSGTTAPTLAAYVGAGLAWRATPPAARRRFNLS